MEFPPFVNVFCRYDTLTTEGGVCSFQLWIDIRRREKEKGSTIKIKK